MARSRRFKFTQTDIILVGGAAALGAVALVASARGNPISPPPVASVSRITINADYTSVSEGGSIPFFGLALDAFENPVVGARLYFLTDGSNVANTLTTSGGQYAFDISFNTAPGMYNCVVSTAP